MSILLVMVFLSSCTIFIDQAKDLFKWHYAGNFMTNDMPEVAPEEDISSPDLLSWGENMYCCALITAEVRGIMLGIGSINSSLLNFTIA